MTLDLACAAPAFLDLTFVGVPELPAPGQERFASELHRSPGGGAITAIGGARLGLSTALASRLGEDEAGDFLRAALRVEGIAVSEARAPTTAVTVVIPHDGERAMVTYDPRVPVTAGELERLAPRAVVCGLDQLELVPPDARAYATVGDEGATAFALTLPRTLDGAHALMVNAAEAATLTGERDPEAALRALGEKGRDVVVTLGPDGAIASLGGAWLRVGGEAVEPVLDTTGAGDLFAAAYVWGDLAGLEPDTRLRYAVLYSALSVTTVTGARGAVPLAHLLAEGERRGLPRVA